MLGKALHSIHSTNRFNIYVRLGFDSRVKQSGACMCKKIHEFPNIPKTCSFRLCTLQDATHWRPVQVLSAFIQYVFTVTLIVLSI